MKAWGIGLIILLIGLILTTYATYGFDYRMVHEPMEVTQDELETATTIGLVAPIISLIGVAIFIYEFMKHEHKS